MTNMTTAFGNTNTIYTAKVLENPTYYPAHNGGSDAIFFKAQMSDGKVVRTAMRAGVINAFLTKAEGKAPQKDDGSYDFRGLEISGRGNLNTSASNGQVFLNFGYILGVEAKADPAPKAEAAPAPKAEAKKARAARAHKA